MIDPAGFKRGATPLSPITSMQSATWPNDVRDTRDTRDARDARETHIPSPRSFGRRIGGILLAAVTALGTSPFLPGVYGQALSSADAATSSPSSMPAAEAIDAIDAIDDTQEMTAREQGEIHLQAATAANNRIAAQVSGLLDQAAGYAEIGRAYQRRIEADVAYYAAWFDGFPHAAWAVDADERLLIANALTLRLFKGYLGEDWRGRKMADLFGEEAAARSREKYRRLDQLAANAAAAAEAGRESPIPLSLEGEQDGIDGSRWHVTRWRVVIPARPCEEMGSADPTAEIVLYCGSATPLSFVPVPG